MSFDPSGLLGPQIPHSERLIKSIEENGFGLDLSETGTGKTYAAGAISRHLKHPVVLICPKSVMSTWIKVLARFGVKPKVSVNYELLARGNTKWMKFKKQPDPNRPHVVGATEKLPFFKLPKDSLVILDEGHRCKGLDTTNSQMLVSLTVQKVKTLVCSATAACSPLDMKALGYLLGLHGLHDFADFCRLHGSQWVGKWGAQTWDGNEPAAKAGMLAINRYIFENISCASRMTREMFGDLFPESHVVAEAYSLGANDPKIQRVYDEMEFELDRLEERTSKYKEHIFAILMKARRQAEMLKVPTFVEMVEDLYDEGKSVVLFVNFSDTADAVAARLTRQKRFRGQIAYVVGGQSASERDRDIEDFQSDKKRICIVNTAAGGVGISLHDLNGKYPRASIVSPTWSAINMMQCLGRVWRQGGLSKSYQRIVYAAGCIEEEICRRVQSKLDNLSLLNDGDLAEITGWIFD